MSERQQTNGFFSCSMCGGAMSAAAHPAAGPCSCGRTQEPGVGSLSDEVLRGLVEKTGVLDPAHRGQVWNSVGSIADTTEILKEAAKRGLLRRKKGSVPQ